MLGRHAGKIVDLRLVDIHGARFYDITYALDTALQVALTSRIGVESVYENPQPGDEVTLHLVLGQLTKIEKRN